MPVFFSYAQVREDLQKHTAGLSDDQVWKPVSGNSLGFQLKHLAGSVDRITTYLIGQQLSTPQLDFLKQEPETAGALSELLALVERNLHRSQTQLQMIDPQSLYAFPHCRPPRPSYKRDRLIVHLAEHTQRHLGQAITIAKILRQSA